MRHYAHCSIEGCSISKLKFNSGNKWNPIINSDIINSGGNGKPCCNDDASEFDAGGPGFNSQGLPDSFHVLYDSRRDLASNVKM